MGKMCDDITRDYLATWFDRPVWASDYAHGNLSPEMCAYIERNLPGIPPIKTFTEAALILQNPEPLAVTVMRGSQ